MMKLISIAGLSKLEQFFEGKILIAFDYDGTLSPIVSHHGDAMLRPTTLSRLKEVSNLFPVAVITGRALGDIQNRIQEIKSPWFVGNHGFEWAQPSVAQKRALKQAQTVIENRSFEVAQALPSYQGLENKGYTLSLHFKNAREQKQLMEFISKRLKFRKDVRIILGHKVFNIVPEGAMHKGEAFCELLKQTGCDRGIYVGDDVTDEDVFGLRLGSKLFSIRIGRRKNSKAKYYLSQQKEIDELLKILVRLGKKKNDSSYKRHQTIRSKSSVQERQLSNSARR